jgi:hypothetical protein
MVRNVSERNFTYTSSVPASMLSQTSQDTNVFVLTHVIYSTHTENRRKTCH